jgi:hypothetical protein
VSEETGFERWITTLRHDVVQGEYGYEEGEFDVTPELWRPLHERGLTPSEAFRSALDAASAARREIEAERRENRRRIQSADAALEASDQGGILAHKETA